MNVGVNENNVSTSEIGEGVMAQVMRIVKK